jgi:CRISPR-associated protein Csd2
MTAMNSTIADPRKRQDFVFLYDVTNGNPNGDPDANNAPRADPDTGIGLVTDVSIKRKVRDAVALMKGEAHPFRIYVQTQGIALNALHEEAHVNTYPAQATSEEQGGNGAEKAKRERRSDPEEVKGRRQYMYEHFWDVRMFGAVMSTGDYPAGQVHGPLQIMFADSVDPINSLDLAITRVAVTNFDPQKPDKRTEIGRKMVLPYALYRGAGFFSPAWARLSGASAEDLAVFWEAFQQMWDNHHSAASGMQALWRIIVFSHDNPLGNAPTHQLFSRIRVARREGVEFPRNREDYMVTIEEDNLPQGITLTVIEC